MLLSDYVWSRNPRGLHVASAFQTPLEISRYQQIHAGWAKLLAAGIEYVDDARALMDVGITPVVRLYLGRYGAQPFTMDLRAIMDPFILAGVKWFEFYNEPNLGVEWQEGFDPSWQDMDNVIRPLMDNWLLWAEYTVSHGCYPGFIPLAESDTPRYAAVPWMDAFLNYLAQNAYERFQRVLANGMYVATHPYTLNHFYQEGAGGRPRAPEQLNAREGGWHFEYPYDPVSQAADPGRTLYGGTPQTPYGDPVGLTAMGRMFNERAAQIFGSNAVPVLGTEGGIFPFRPGVFQQDRRYPSYNEHSQAEATVAMFEWIARQAPPWFFGVTLWKEDEYYLPGGGPVPAVGRLAETPPVYKDVPPLEVMNPGFLLELTPEARGPGPIHGQADHHMIILAPELDTSWFFDTAQSYWDAFRPIVTTHTELIDFIPNTQSLAVTVIAPPDMVDAMRLVITDRYPNVYFDLILADDLNRVRYVLQDRALVNRRFG
jgi:hypothetical protein